MKSASPLRDAGPAPIASAFALPSDLLHITPLGQGNVNDTYLVQCTGGERVVLQRLNTRVFPRPAEVMANLSRLCAHSAGRPWPQADQPRRWDLPRLVPVRPERASAGGNSWLEQNGECWRMLTYVADSHSHDTLSTPEQAAEVGRALGGFHHQSYLGIGPCPDVVDTDRIGGHASDLDRVIVVIDLEGQFALPFDDDFSFRGFGPNPLAIAGHGN